MFIKSGDYERALSSFLSMRSYYLGIRAPLRQITLSSGDGVHAIKRDLHDPRIAQMSTIEIMNAAANAATLSSEVTQPTTSPTTATATATVWTPPNVTLVATHGGLPPLNIPSGGQSTLMERRVAVRYAQMTILLMRSKAPSLPLPRTSLPSPVTSSSLPLPSSTSTLPLSQPVASPSLSQPTQGSLEHLLYHDRFAAVNGNDDTKQSDDDNTDLEDQIRRTRDMVPSEKRLNGLITQLLHPINNTLSAPSSSDNGSKMLPTSTSTSPSPQLSSWDSFKQAALASRVTPEQLMVEALERAMWFGRSLDLLLDTAVQSKDIRQVMCAILVSSLSTPPPRHHTPLSCCCCWVNSLEKSEFVCNKHAWRT
jgi:hypothetical protein